MASDPDDWQTTALLTRARAESGDIVCRYAGIAHMLDLKRRGITPPGMRDYVVEHVKVREKTVIIKTSLEPWGGYHVYAIGQVTESGGRIFFRIALESDDADKMKRQKECGDFRWMAIRIQA
jgi:hypothetical protein